MEYIQKNPIACLSIINSTAIAYLTFQSYQQKKIIADLTARLEKLEETTEKTLTRTATLVKRQTDLRFDLDDITNETLDIKESLYTIEGDGVKIDLTNLSGNGKKKPKQASTKSVAKKTQTKKKAPVSKRRQKEEDDDDDDDDVLDDLDD